MDASPRHGRSNGFGNFQAARRSADGRQIAFLENPEDSWHFRHRFGIASTNAPSLKFIDWPRLWVDAGAVPQEQIQRKAAAD